MAKCCAFFVLLLTASRMTAFTPRVYSKRKVVNIKSSDRSANSPHNTKVPMSVPASSSEANQERSASGLLVSNIHHLGHDGIRFILASQSPRRREILDMMGLSGRYTATPSPLDESALQTTLANRSISPLQYTCTLAEEKARALAVSLSEQYSAPSTLILGSDTIVDLDGAILEKPNDQNSARHMLQQLSGQWHKVHTAVAIFHVKEDHSVTLMSSFIDTAQVKFASLSPADINAYVNTGEPMDKAGSYGIQGIGGQFVERMEGDFFTVMGLPMHRVSRELSLAISIIKNQGDELCQ